jgi:hypothetical protein
MIISGVAITGVIIATEPISISIHRDVTIGAGGVMRLAVVTEQRKLLARGQVAVGINARCLLDGVLVVVNDDVIALGPCLIQQYK